MKNLIALMLIFTFSFSYNIFAQQKHDKGKLIEYKNEFWDEIKKSVEEFEKEEKKPKLSFKMDFNGYDLPESKDKFKSYWHNDPVSQGWSGMCWCFSTTSMLESDLYRISGKKMKFSELHTVYWEYVEKARRFVRERGNSLFAEGSQGNAVLRIWKKYGCVPEDVYTGKKPGQKFHAHEKMFHEMSNYLKSVKQNNAWNEDEVISTIMDILDHYLGPIPEKFKFNGKEMTPKEFLANEVKLNPDDYIDIMSIMNSPYWKKGEYPVPDNWWHSMRYNNVPLDVFMETINKAVENGYTLFIGGDVSESGYNSHYDAAVVPSYDIPSDYIDEYARQFRFSNKSTTDDHGIHIVGYKKDDNGKYWYLIKDSGSGSRNGKEKGYYFYHEDYVKLKMMNFIVHKSAVKDLLNKMEKE